MSLHVKYLWQLVSFSYGLEFEPITIQMWLPGKVGGGAMLCIPPLFLLRCGRVFFLGRPCGRSWRHAVLREDRRQQSGPPGLSERRGIHMRAAHVAALMSLSLRLRERSGACTQVAPSLPRLQAYKKTGYLRINQWFQAAQDGRHFIYPFLALEAFTSPA